MAQIHIKVLVLKLPAFLLNCADLNGSCAQYCFLFSISVVHVQPKLGHTKSKYSAVVEFASAKPYRRLSIVELPMYGTDLQTALRPCR